MLRLRHNNNSEKKCCTLQAGVGSAAMDWEAGLVDLEGLVEGLVGVRVVAVMVEGWAAPDWVVAGWVAVGLVAVGWAAADLAGSEG
jgi:hypothetical protein